MTEKTKLTNWCANRFLDDLNTNSNVKISLIQFEKKPRWPPYLGKKTLNNNNNNIENRLYMILHLKYRKIILIYNMIKFYTF